MKVNFFEVFRENSDGTLSPVKHIQIGEVTLSPLSISFSRDVSFSGVNLFDYYGSDLEVDQKSGLLILKGFYK